MLMKESYGRLYVGKTSILKIGQPSSDSVYFYYVIKAPFSTVTNCIIFVPCLSMILSSHLSVMLLILFAVFILSSPHRQSAEGIQSEGSNQCLPTKMRQISHLITLWRSAIYLYITNMA